MNAPEFSCITNDIITIKHNDEWGRRTTPLYYDITNDREIVNINSLYPNYIDSTIVDGGYISGYDNYFREYHVNGQAYTVEHLSVYSSKQKHYELIAETGAIHLYGGAIVTVSFETKKSVEIIHTDQPITKE